MEVSLKRRWFKLFFSEYFIEFCRWNSVAEFVISSVHSQLDENPSYSIVMSGHSLGGKLLTSSSVLLYESLMVVSLGALSSIGGTALKYIFNTT